MVPPTEPRFTPLAILGLQPMALTALPDLGPGLDA